MRRIHHSPLVVCSFLIWLGSAAGESKKIAPIRVWTDKDLAEWATPVAGLNVRPGHFSEKEYYSVPPGEFLRTYPVYLPGREPAGYSQWIASRKPEPLLQPGARTKAAWIQAGKTVFREMDVLAVRSYDPDLMEIVRSAEALTKAGGRPQPDGSIPGLRWVPTSKGLAISVDDCGGCHSRVMQDGSLVDGIPLNGTGNAVIGQLVSRFLRRVYSDSPAQWNWRSSAVPWVPGDIHASLPGMEPKDISLIFRAMVPGTFARFNGSPYFPTKVPDLIGVGDRRYIDHTATHRLRNIGDFMRYAALVGCCDSADFGSHRMFSDAQRKIRFRYPDEVLFALAQYVYSLQPPPNPNLHDARIGQGQKVFTKEGCAGCHTPPLYTNNKLTLAEGFQLPNGHPLKADVLPVSVGTDPGLALKTRKGTGLYKVPSLKNVWYRTLLGHDGSVTSLEEWFDPARLGEDYVPTGFKGAGLKTRAIKGHEFGLKLNADDKAALIAFLKSL